MPGTSGSDPSEGKYVPPHKRAKASGDPAASDTAGAAAAAGLPRAKGNTSASLLSSASQHERECAKIIAVFLNKNGIAPITLGPQPRRIIPWTSEMKALVWTLYPPKDHPFWSKSRLSPSLESAVEMDYFAYATPLTTSATAAAAAAEATVFGETDALAAIDAVRRTLDPSPDAYRESPQRDPACIFEVTLSDLWPDKLFQVELRLAAFVAKRGISMGESSSSVYCPEFVLSQVAFAGVCIPSNCHERTNKYLALRNLNKLFPLIAIMLAAGKFAVLDADSSKLVWTAPPNEAGVWVNYHGSVFMVTPTKNIVDSLKDAVKVKKPNALRDRDADTLVVKDASGAVLEPDAPLVANKKETAYIVE